jgi:hypothetical protein
MHQTFGLHNVCDEMTKSIPVRSALSAGSSCKSTCWSALRQVAVLRLKTTVAECLLLTDCSDTDDGGVGCDVGSGLLQ